MEQIIKDLFQFNRTLIGEGYDSALQYIQHLIPLEVIKVKSGTKVGDWTVPDEWIIRDGWVKLNGEKILDYTEQPLSVMVGSDPIHTTVDKKEFMDHLHISDEKPDATAYAFNFYEPGWGFSMPKNKVKEEVLMNCVGGVCTPIVKELDESVGQVRYDNMETKQEWHDLLPEGDYEVFIDSEKKPGTMKIGIHTIPGKTDREILIFTHLDHPYQANDGLSGVACLLNLVESVKLMGFDHTIKLIFCPETIGGIAYATLQDISKVDFVIGLCSVGNEGSMLIQKAFDKDSRLNAVMHLAHSGQAIDYRKADFRFLAGGEEYFFNYQMVGIPGIFLSRIGDKFDHYHTSDDTPEKINYDKIKEAEKAILKIIEVYEKDFIPVRKIKGPLMRSKYDVQTPHKMVNLSLDYLWYDIDGKKYLSEIILPLGLSFETAYELTEKCNAISRLDTSKKQKSKVARKKHS
jgi:aminopeptidase-like protein